MRFPIEVTNFSEKMTNFSSIHAISIRVKYVVN